MSYLSRKGQSFLEYCIECAVKHGQTSKVFMREGLQRAEVDGPQSEGVQEKVRGVVEELSGMEADTETTKNENVTRINTDARDLRKFIHSTQAEIGGASLDQLQEIKEKVDTLVDKTYKVREQEEECPTCIVNTGEDKTKESVNLDEVGTESREKRKKFLEELTKDNVQDELF